MHNIINQVYLFIKQLCKVIGVKNINFSTLDNSRRRNSLKILELLLNERLSRADIADITGLTRTSVGNIIKKFMDIGFVEEKDFKSSGVGRKRVLLDIVPSFMYAVGVAVSRSQIEGCLIDSKGKLIDSELRRFKKDEDVLEVLYSVIDKLMNLASRNSLNVKAIGVGVPGPLDVENGIVINPPKFPGFSNVKLVELLESRYGIDTWIGNDADLAAWGEKCYGEGRNLEDFIYIYTSEGIGAGIIINNQLYHGKLGYSGEIGHVLIKKGGEFEYFENLYGKDKLLEKAKKIDSKIEDLDYLEIKYSKNKEIASLLREVAENLGGLIISIIHITGISDVFIGGDYRVFGDFFLNNIREIIKRYEFSNQEINIKFSQLGDLAMPLGAGAYAIGMYLKKLILEL